MKCELRTICDFRKGKIEVSKLNQSTYISTENMVPDKGGVVDASSLPNSLTTQEFQPGDILVSNIRPYFKKIWHAKYSGGCSNDVLVFTAKGGVDPAFLYYLLSDDAFFSFSTATSKGTKMPRGDRKAIMQYAVPQYDLPTQKKIGPILRSLDDKIELNNKINENLEQQAVLLIERYIRSTDNAVPLSEIMCFDNGFAFQSKNYLPSGKYRIITIKNVQDGFIDSTGAAFIDSVPQNMKACCFLHTGDVLLSLTGNVGRVGIVCENNLLLNQRVAKFMPFESDLLPFLYFLFRQPIMKSKLETIAKGTAQLNLSPVETLRQEIPYEKETAKACSQALNALYRAIISNNQQNFALKKLRDNLLPKLMNGEIEIK